MSGKFGIERKKVWYIEEDIPKMCGMISKCLTNINALHICVLFCNASANQWLLLKEYENPFVNGPNNKKPCSLIAENVLQESRIHKFLSLKWNNPCTSIFTEIMISLHISTCINVMPWWFSIHVRRFSSKIIVWLFSNGKLWSFHTYCSTLRYWNHKLKPSTFYHASIFLQRNPISP